MLADISSTVNAAIGSRDWWDWWGDAAAIAVTVGVVLESVTEFKFLAKITGLSARETLREGIAKFGLGLLIVALIAEVIVGRHVKAATDTIESALTRSLHDTVAANSDLSQRIEKEKTDIAGVKFDTDQQRRDIGTAQGKISDLGDQETALRKQFAADHAALAPRQVTQKARIARALRATLPAGLTIGLYIIADEEAGIYAEEIAETLRRAGMNPAIVKCGEGLGCSPRFPGSVDTVGVTVWDPQADVKKKLVAAFRCGKTTFEQWTVDSFSGTSVKSASIFVGHKRAPFVRPSPLPSKGYWREIDLPTGVTEMIFTAPPPVPACPLRK